MAIIYLGSEKINIILSYLELLFTTNSKIKYISLNF